MNQTEFVRLLAERTGRSDREVRQFLQDVRQTATDVLSGGDKVTLSGLAVFTPKHRPARAGRNPKSGEAIHVRSRTVVQIRPLKALRDAVDGG